MYTVYFCHFMIYKSDTYYFYVLWRYRISIMDLFEYIYNLKLLINWLNNNNNIVIDDYV